MLIVFASFKLPSLPISIKIPVTLLQIVYIYMTAISPNLSSMNYLFANLVVAWLLDATDTSKNIEIFHATSLAFRLKHSIGADECLTRQKMKPSIR